MFLGPPGTGKTHLAIGLGIRACQAGHRVAVRHRRRMGRPPRRRPPRRPAAGRAGPARPLSRCSIIDEVGYIPFEAEAANLFFQLVSARYERASADRHQQQALRPLGRGLRRRRRRRRHDRPPRPPRRGRLPQRRQLPAQRPRPRPRPRGHHRRTMTTKGVSFQPPPGGQFSAVVDNQKHELPDAVFQVHGQVAGLLGHPRPGRARRHAQDVDAAGGKLDHEQHIQTPEQDRFDVN